MKLPFKREGERDIPFAIGEGLSEAARVSAIDF